MLAWPNPNDPICSLLYFFEFLRLLFVWLCVCLFVFFFSAADFKADIETVLFLLANLPSFFCIGRPTFSRKMVFDSIWFVFTHHKYVHQFFFKFFFISFPLTFLLTAWHDPTDVCGIQRQSRNVWAADSSRSRCEL